MAYPSTLDELTDGVPSDGAAPTTPLGDPTYPLDDWARAISVAVEAVEAELGTDPAGASATVKARLDALDTTVAGKVPASLVDAAGDLIYATGSDTVARLPLGSAAQVLRVNAGATAPEWAAAASGAVSVIARTVLGSDTASVDFTSIPATYESLRVVYTAKGTGSSGMIWPVISVRFNGDTAANYGWQTHRAQGDSGGLQEKSTGAVTLMNMGYVVDSSSGVTAGFAGDGVMDVPSYCRTTYVKKALGLWNSRYSLGNTGQTGEWSGVWNNTAAVTQLTFYLSEGSFKTGSVFTLYGVAGA